MRESRTTAKRWAANATANRQQALRKHGSYVRAIGAHERTTSAEPGAVYRSFSQYCSQPPGGPVRKHQLAVLSMAQTRFTEHQSPSSAWCGA